MNEKTEENISQNNNPRIIDKLMDPFMIFSILSMVNFIVLLILFFIQPFWLEINEEELTSTFYYWNGYFSSYNSTTSTLIDSGFSETYPKGASIVYLIAIIFMLICTIAQILSLLFSKKMTGKKFMTIYTWPNFVIIGLMMAGVFSLVNWIIVLKPRILSEGVLLGSFAPIKYGMVLSILMMIAVLGFAAILSIKKEKD